MPITRGFPTPLAPLRVKSDLEWLLNAPSMLKESLAGGIPSWTPHQQRLRQINITQPPSQLKAGPPVMGHYCEELLGCSINQHPDYRLLAQNIQIRQHKDTLGELDFIVETPEGVEHWELAVKIYLHKGGDSRLSHFVGPNTRDRLDIKSQHMWQKQCALASSPTAQAVIEELGYPVPRLSRWCLLGWLFYPWGESPPEFSEIPLNQSTGWWLSVTMLDQLQQDGISYLPLPRLEWLSPLKNIPATVISKSVLDFKQLTELIQQQFAAGDGPILVARTTISHGELNEVDRGFVTPPNWPQQRTLPGFG